MTTITLTVKVVPGARRSMIKKQGEQWKVYLTAPALEGKANLALVEFLAEHFNVRKNCVSIIKGLQSRNKVVKIEGISLQ